MAVSPDSLELPYRWNECDSRVQVEIGVNDDPDVFGGEEFARGFPYCRATIEPAAVGYREMIGWIQMVDISDRAEGFEVDLFEPLGEIPHPFAFFGFSPTLFDSPHTSHSDWDFLAHTFLCGLGGKLLEQAAGDRREIRAVLGFEWGLSKRGNGIVAIGPRQLAVDDWNGHLPYLRRRFEQWTFPSGFYESPLP